MGRAGLLLLGLLAVSVVHAGVDLVTREVLGRACKRYIDKDPLLPCDSTFSDKASELKIVRTSPSHARSLPAPLQMLPDSSQIWPLRCKRGRCGDSYLTLPAL